MLVLQITLGSVFRQLSPEVAWHFRRRGAARDVPLYKEALGSHE